MNRTTRSAVALATAALVATGVLAAAPANAMTGTNSLAAVLTATTPAFDKNGKDFDIVTKAVLTVLEAKPDSPVKVLTDGTTPVTAFIPTDKAFMNLVKSLTKKTPKTEKATFDAVAGLGIDKVEQILLFHVVPGATVMSPDALKSNGASLNSALTGKVLKVSVKGTTIRLADYNKKLADPKVILSAVDINSGNAQVAHGIDAVLMPTK